MGGPPPESLFNNLSRFRSLDSEKAFTYHIWLDQNYVLPPSCLEEGVYIHQIVSAFRNVSPFKLLPNLEGIFLRERFGAFNNLAAASDIARYVILYTEGGIYMDADAEVHDVRVLHQFYRQALASNVVYVTTANNRLYQGVILSEKYHHFWHQVFRGIISKYHQPYSYGAKRHFSAARDGQQRVTDTVMTSGIGAMLGAQAPRLPASLAHFDQHKCFKPIDASASNYRHRPAFLRHNSCFW